ncbi:MAG TPA: formylglycine-generating enzyme family protein [Usitatibacter sp.]|jgi:formylglycine-generating enzyme required for sulfatase activity|nr:formylglycine-generating enzyme family protein [Usitatibacter sp.]
MKALAKTVLIGIASFTGLACALDGCALHSGAERAMAVGIPAAGAAAPQELSLAWIPAGSFTMGTPKTEAAHRANESPPTRVTLTDGFWMGTHEVTNGQWKALMGDSVLEQARKAQMDDFPFAMGAGTMHLRDYFKLSKDGDTMRLVGNTDDEVPIIWVSWEESREFCRRLNELARVQHKLPEGYTYRLPTEAEWEYAARAGTTGATHAGEMVIASDHTAAVLEGIAWYAGNAREGYEGHAIDTTTWIKNKAEGAGRAGPRKVGTKAPNAWGLYDMLGNVAEWCLDWEGPLPGGSVIDWKGPPAGKMRIRRGGGWSTFASHARAGYRNAHEPNFRWINLGFRVVLAKPA